MRFREFDLCREAPEKIWDLYGQVYGNVEPFRARWDWEFVRNPLKERVRIFVAETETGRLTGMTVRLPCDLRLGNEIYPANFATNSMVAKEYRGQGIIRELYSLAAKSGELQLSKGTEATMYQQLQKMGYQEIVPNTYQICLLRPWAWAYSKLTGKVAKRHCTDKVPAEFPDFSPVSRFDDGFNGFAPVLPISIMKDADYLNWRYIDIPHRKYLVFCRKIQEKPVSWMVLRRTGHTAILVDLAWRENYPDEPRHIIRFAKALARNNGAVKVVFWGTFKFLRQSLGKEFFLVRNESPRFCFFRGNSSVSEKNIFDNSNFVHGDGDVDYL